MNIQTETGFFVDVRDATENDIPLLLSFVRDMAAYEKLTVSATEESFRAALFGASPAARAVMVVTDGTPIGYMVYFFTFSTMLGKRGVWLEDVFVDAAFRGKGIGRALIAYLAQIAKQNNCGRCEWTVLDWNEGAIRFYRRIGATVLPDWRICRMNELEIANLARTVKHVQRHS